MRMFSTSLLDIYLVTLIEEEVEPEELVVPECLTRNISVELQPPQTAAQVEVVAGYNRTLGLGHYLVRTLDGNCSAFITISQHHPGELR